MSRKRYFLGNEKHARPMRFYIRSGVVAKYHGAIDAYRKLRVFKQVFEVMKICKENGGYITKGEFVAILREKLSTESPSSQELDHFNTELFQFRRWMGALAGMLVYAKHEHIPEVHDIQWIYRPIKNKTEYKEVRKHIEKTLSGLDARNEQNKTLLNMTPKQIERRIREVAEELDLEVKGY